MQKIKQELNENPVGANCVRPHFEEITKNNQKGITLIALIITIIVMLILVGVTINVALNGGLFQKAEQAKTQTQKETDQEELQLAVVASLNDDLEIPDANAIKNNLSEGWSVTGPENGVYTCISPKLNEFTVNETDKKITYEGISNGKTKEPKFYGVAYRGYTDHYANIYFFKDGIMLFCNEEDGYCEEIDTYIKNENQLKLETFEIFGTLSEDFNTIVLEGLGEFTRNEDATLDLNNGYTPAFVYVQGINKDSSYNVRLSNNDLQEKGEYKTTILIENDYSTTVEYNITFTLTGAISNRKYIQEEDYSYNSSTREIVIFNLTEPVLMDMEISRK